MEKDLRDAYKALKLMRADLTRTRKEKQALADQLAQCTNDNSESNNDSLDGVHALQQELTELQSAYNALTREHETLQLLHAQGTHHKHVVTAATTSCDHIDSDSSATKAPRTRAAEHAHSSSSDDRQINDQDTASARTATTERDPIGSSHSSTSSSDVHDHHSVADLSTVHDNADIASLQEEMARKQLELMAKLFELKSERDALATQLVTEKATFARERDELCMQLEELSEQLVALQDHVLDVEHEKQFMAEKYAFLSTQLDLIQRHEQQRPDALATSDSDADDGLERKLRELESIRDQLESERRLLQQQQQQHASPVGSDAKSSSAAATAESETARRLTGLLQSNASLQQQLRATESELARLKQDAVDASSPTQPCAQCQETGRDDAVPKALEADAQDLAHANATLTHSLDAITRERDDLRTQCQALEHAATIKDARVNELDALAVDAKTALEAHARESQDLRTRLEALRERESELFERMEAANADARAASEQQRAVYEAERSTLEARLRESERTAEALTAAEQTLQARVAELDAELARRIDDVTRLERAAAETETQRRTHLAQTDKAAKASAMEVKALVLETRELSQALKHKQDALAAAEAALDALRQELQALQTEQEQKNQNAAAQRERENQNAVTLQRALELRLSSLETQLMAREDIQPRAVDAALDDLANASDSRVWPAIASHAQALESFLPQLELFARVVDATLCLCAANASALETLSSQHDRLLAQDIVAQLCNVRQLQSVVTESSLLKRARQVDRRVQELLSHWCECVEHDASPAPPFGIASREASLVLHNWTRDRSKRLAATRWLAYMETVSSPLPSPLSKSASPRPMDDALTAEPLLAVAEGSTLELQQMTLEVKQAFLMLIVPILRRNAAIYVRVFTRQASSTGTTSAGPSATTAQDNEDDRLWEMKIHVQLCRHQRRASASSLSSSTSMAAAAASPLRRVRPPPLDLATSSSTSRQHSHLAHESDVTESSAGVMTPSSSAQKLQIIQQRLHHMQLRG